MDFETPIDQASIVVLDTETTGLRAGQDRITELGAVLLSGGTVVDRFQTLIDPGIPIPPGITRLTGISNRMVAGQPAAADVLPAFFHFAGDALLVGHNVKFDLGFLEAEARRAGLEMPDNPSLCTARLARRLLRALPSRSLVSLKRHYGIKVERAHRALDDAEATAQVLHHLLDSVRAERGLHTIGELVRWQFLSYRATLKEPAFVERLRDNLRDRLPDTPGVYFHRNGKGELLYVGKAKNLKNRVLSYFTAYAAHPIHIRKLVREVRDVTWQETGSELSALLLESRLIKELRPRFNRAQTEYRNRPFIRIDSKGEARWTYHILDDEAAYYGPLAHRNQAEGLIELAEQLFGLAVGSQPRQNTGRRWKSGNVRPDSVPEAVQDEEAEPAELFGRLLTGDHDRVSEQVFELMTHAAQNLKYEEAAWWKRKMQLLDQVETRQNCIASPVHELSCLLIQPSTDGGSMELYALKCGRLIGDTNVSKPLSQAGSDTIRRLVRHVFWESPPDPGTYGRRELDEVRIVAEWLVVHAGESKRLDWNPEVSIDHFVQNILAACSESCE